MEYSSHNKEITCYILLDAFKEEYIKHTIFMKNIEKRYISKIEEQFGFASYRSAAFAGVYPETSNICTMWCYSSKTSIYKRFKPFLKFMDKINSKQIRNFIGKMFSGLLILSQKIGITKLHPVGWYNPIDIPFNLLPYLDISEKTTETKPGYLSTKTLFDLLRLHNKRFIYLGGSEDGFFLSHNYKKNIKRAINEIVNKNPDFIYFHVGDSDVFGHAYGPNGEETNFVHKYEDKFVEDIYKFLKDRYEIVNLIVGGDHGMVKVINTINIWEKLQNLSIKLEKDYIVFLDSPMARFWFFNEKAENEIREMLEKLDCGKILTEEDYKKYKIRFKDNRYGDLIWLANPGTLIFPNFFGWYKPVKGMHGYAPECEDNKGAFMIITNKNIEFEKRENLKMVDVFPTLCDIMNLPIPKSCEGKSIVKKGHI
ncbi:hypothetical protein MSIBF_A380003 [groundwater metagenome]|uniref:Type I phosphodiesterase/nucleotide pyrophosphatase n=1 Tax=groundwater metagenome TaxID=717931 RepID=A0A098EEC5_9ZZZZ